MVDRFQDPWLGLLVKVVRQSVKTARSGCFHRAKISVKNHKGYRETGKSKDQNKVPETNSKEKQICEVPEKEF